MLGVARIKDEEPAGVRCLGIDMIAADMDEVAETRPDVLCSPPPWVVAFGRKNPTLVQPGDVDDGGDSHSDAPSYVMRVREFGHAIDNALEIMVSAAPSGIVGQRLGPLADPAGRVLA